MTELDLHATSMNGSAVTRRNKTIFVALPVALRRPIEGGCSCAYCAAHPDQVPAWDTLAIGEKKRVDANDVTWVVHAPEIAKHHPDTRVILAGSPWAHTDDEIGEWSDPSSEPDECPSVDTDRGW